MRTVSVSAAEADCKVMAASAKSKILFMSRLFFGYILLAILDVDSLLGLCDTLSL